MRGEHRRTLGDRTNPAGGLAQKRQRDLCLHLFDCSGRGPRALAPALIIMSFMSEHAQLPPILTAHLYPKIEEMLLALLRSLAADDWERQTIAPKWKVKDVAAHLLDTQLRKLSIARDGYLPPAPPITDLLAFIDRLNLE